MTVCSHPPLAEVTQLLICRTCHAAKVVGVLAREGSEYALRSGDGLSFAIPIMMVVDPALVGKRVRVTIEALPEEASKEVVTGAS